MSRPVLQPSPRHPITIEPSAERVIVRRDGRTIADTTRALVLQEASYPPVRYIPLTDVNREELTDSETTSYCPFKGDAAYLSAPGRDDVAWYYPVPHDAVREIADHVAFYPDRVQIEVQPA